MTLEKILIELGWLSMTKHSQKPKSMYKMKTLILHFVSFNIFEANLRVFDIQVSKQSVKIPQKGFFEADNSVVTSLSQDYSPMQLEIQMSS